MSFLSAKKLRLNLVKLKSLNNSTLRSFTVPFAIKFFTVPWSVKNISISEITFPFLILLFNIVL